MSIVKDTMLLAGRCLPDLEYNSERSNCTDNEEVHYFESYNADTDSFVGIAVTFLYGKTKFPVISAFCIENADIQIGFNVGRNGNILDYCSVLEYYQTFDGLTYKVSYSGQPGLGGKLEYSILNGEKEVARGFADVPWISPFFTPHYLY